MSAREARIRVGAFILGAGASSRMGQPKLLLRWGETTIVGHLISVWKTAGAQQIAPVCAPPPHPLHHELDRLGLLETDRIINPMPERGMFSSIQCAACWGGWQSDLTHYAILLGDQPQIPCSTVQAVMEHAAANAGTFCQPAFQGRPKHPVILPKVFFEELAAAKCTTLRSFLEEHSSSRSFLEVADESLILDLDSPADYQAAIERFEKTTEAAELDESKATCAGKQPTRQGHPY